MDVSAVIVNYRSAALVLDCLESLAQEQPAIGMFDVVVVENNSRDGSYDILTEAVRSRGWGRWVHVQKMPANGGFSYGVNAGVGRGMQRAARPAAFWLLNPDTVVRPGALRALTDALAESDDVGIVGSRLEDPDGTPQDSRFRFPNVWNELDTGFRFGPVHRLIGSRATCPRMSDEPHEIDWLAGASMMIRREVFEQIGMFDEGFFLYFEELDFARRARDVGVRTRYIPASRVVHLVGQSTGVTARGRRPGRTPAYWFGSRKRYYRKHHSFAYKLLADVAFVVGRLGYHALRLCRRREDTQAPKFLRDFVRCNWLGADTSRPAEGAPSPARNDAPEQAS